MNEFFSQMSYTSSSFGPILGTLLVLWTLPWKGVALWRAARKNDTIWFVVLLLVNTLGILEILYIFIFNKRKMK